jgi:hypothetical protein
MIFARSEEKACLGELLALLCHKKYKSLILDGFFESTLKDNNNKINDLRNF